MRSMIWLLMGGAIVAGAYVNALFWGAALPALAVLFFAIDILKPFLFAAGSVFRLVACAAMVVSATASTLFMSNLLGGSIGDAGRDEAHLAEIVEELASLRNVGSGDGLTETLAAAQSDRQHAVDMAERARLTVGQARDAQRTATKARDAAEAAMHTPEACGPSDRPSPVGSVCRERRRLYAAAVDAAGDADRRLADAVAELKRIDQFKVTTERAASQAAAAVDQAAISSAQNAARVETLEAERAAVSDRLSAGGAAVGLRTVARWAAMDPADFSAFIAAVAAVVAELFCTIAPAALLALVGLPAFMTDRSGPKVRSTPIGDGSLAVAGQPNACEDTTYAQMLAGHERPTAGGPSVATGQQSAKRRRKVAHGGARFDDADRLSLTEQGRRLVGNGATKAEAARTLGLSESTLKRWLSERPTLRAVR